MKRIPAIFAVLMVVTAAYIMHPTDARAVPASPQTFTVTQPDGTKIEVRRMGDERRNWTETADGYTVLQDKETGVWEYAITGDCGELMPSGVAVSPGAGPPADLPKHIKPPADKEMRRDYGPGGMQGPRY